MRGVPRPSLILQDADALARRIRFDIGREVRDARLDGGISQRNASSRVGMSHSQFGRIERGQIEEVTVEQLSRACAAVGLRLSARAVPGSGVALDAGQLALIGRLRSQLPPWVRVRTEVPIPLPGDRRAWDVVLGLDPDDTAVEAEARLRDIQALDRRHGLKLRDSDINVLVLVVADTPHNRRMLELYREDLRASFPLDTRQVMAALRKGRTPEASGIVVL
jgi:transcriptional regulator with XRE-family HTH domain